MNDQNPNQPHSVHTENQPLEEQKIQLIQEELNVTKKTESQTFLFGKETVTEDISIPVELLTEEITLDRAPIGREVEQMPEIRTEGDTTIIPIVREEAVVVKKLILVEEIRITKKTDKITRTISDSVRKEIFTQSGTGELKKI